MAIDADLSAGMINDQEARRRRKELEAESSFFGAMDGASKFVRGDAVAAIIITLVNMIGGMVIGTMRHDLSVSQAAMFYTTLTIGEGIVSQIPALIVSLGAGMLVSKGAVRGSTDRAFFGQLGGHAKPLFLAAGLAGMFALLPGMPFLPFAALSAASAGGAMLVRHADQRRAQAAAAAARSEENVGGPREEPIAELMRVDDIRIELGMGLVSLTSGPQGGLTEKIRKLRRSIALDYGFLLPAVRIKDNLDLGAGEYSLQVLGVEVARETMELGRLLAFSPGGGKLTIDGIDTQEPSFHIPARWIDFARRQEAVALGLTVVDIETVLTTHLSETVKAHMSQLMSYAATQKLLDGLGQEFQKLVQDLVPALVPMTTLQKVLGNLLAERVSIRHLTLVLEALHEAAAFTRNVRLMTEHVRAPAGVADLPHVAGRRWVHRRDAAVAAMGARAERGNHHRRRPAQFRSGTVTHAGVRADGAHQGGGSVGARCVAGDTDQCRGAPVRAHVGGADQPDDRGDLARRGAPAQQAAHGRTDLIRE